MENVIKGWFTSILGAALMLIAGYDYFFTDVLTEREAIGAAIIGFAMLWMRDKISEWIGQLVTVIIDKFKTKS